MICVAILLLAVAGVAAGTADRQAHSPLAGIVCGGEASYAGATVRVTDELATGSGGKLMIIECRKAERPAETYVAVCGADGRLLDGMLVATDGDTELLRDRVDNEFAQFRPDGQARCTITTDSVIVVRRFTVEIKPVGDTYLRHRATVTGRYALRHDGTIEQIKPNVEIYREQGSLATGADGVCRELPPHSRERVDGGYNHTALGMMSLLQAPITASDTTMAQWTRLADKFARQTAMTGVSDQDHLSAGIYAASTLPLLTQGDGRNMAWVYHHQDRAAAMLKIMLTEYQGTALADDTTIDALKRAARTLADKNARRWWLKQL